jgi:protease I
MQYFLNINTYKLSIPEGIMKRALIITGQGFQDQEVIYPYYRLLEEEFQVDIAAKNKETLFGILGLKIDATLAFQEMNLADFDILILPGGVKALEKIRQEKIVLDFIREWNSTGKIIASTCHGAQLLISARVVNGRKISGYYSIKDDIENAGATYIDDKFVIDRNIISSPHYKHMGPWMKEAISQFYLKNDKKN